MAVQDFYPQDKSALFGSPGQFPTATPSQYAGNLGPMGQFGANMPPPATALPPAIAGAAPVDTGGISDDFAKSMVGLSQNKAKQAELNKQMARAQSLRDIGASQLRGIAAPGRAAAPNYGGAIADVFLNYKAGQMEKAAQEAETGAGGLAEKKSGALFDYFKALQADPKLAKAMNPSSAAPSVSDYFS